MHRSETLSHRKRYMLCLNEWELSIWMSWSPVLIHFWLSAFRIQICLGVILYKARNSLKGYYFCLLILARICFRRASKSVMSSSYVCLSLLMVLTFEITCQIEHHILYYFDWTYGFSLELLLWNWWWLKLLRYEWYLICLFVPFIYVKLYMWMWIIFVRLIIWTWIG